MNCKMTGPRYALMLSAAIAFAPAAGGQVRELTRTLNQHATVDATPRLKSYTVIFDAYLKTSQPPMEVGELFNLNTIHAGMPRWSEVSGWAENNTALADAIISINGDREERKIVIGLPYGKENVPQDYQEAGIYIAVGDQDGNLQKIDFAYFPALDTIEAFVSAEIYRLMEAGQDQLTQRALDLAVANIVMLRQFCDRDFLDEKFKNISLLADALVNLRDVFYVYMDQITPAQFEKIGFFDLPFLRPDRNRLLMPEADRIVATALLNYVFDPDTGQADIAKFRSVFGAIQSADEPLTRFGAAKRWETVAAFHGSLDASLERLEDVYDDWWRRWRVRTYDPILDVETYFSQTNPVRYAAVLESTRDLAELFPLRQRLIVEVNGTAMAAGICSYIRELGAQPRLAQALYSQSMRKSADSDIYDLDEGPFVFYNTDNRYAVDTPFGRVWVERGQAMVWSRGQNHQDDRGQEHTHDGLNGDIVIWPPVKALARQQGVID